jgi:isopentenyl-diphosphate delta-isomerase
MHRAPTERLRRLAGAFADWGIPTAESLEAVREERCALDREDVHIFASGGIRSGQDIAKCAALGADLVGLAGPFLKKALAGPEEVIEEMDILAAELRITMFCSGAGDIATLRRPGVLVRQP